LATWQRRHTSSERSRLFSAAKRALSAADNRKSVTAAKNVYCRGQHWKASTIYNGVFTRSNSCSNRSVRPVAAVINCAYSRADRLPRVIALTTAQIGLCDDRAV